MGLFAMFSTCCHSIFLILPSSSLYDQLRPESFHLSAAQAGDARIRSSALLAVVSVGTGSKYVRNLPFDLQ